MSIGGQDGASSASIRLFGSENVSTVHNIADAAFNIVICHVVSGAWQTLLAIATRSPPPPAPETDVGPLEILSFKEGGRRVGRSERCGDISHFISEGARTSRYQAEPV